MVLCISPKSDITTTTPWTQIRPSFLARGTDWKPPASNTWGAQPMAQLSRHVFTCLPPPCSMKQPTSAWLPSSRAINHWLTLRRLFLLFSASNTVLLLTQSVPWLWDSLGSCIERDYALFIIHRCRQTYTPQTMTGPLLEALASLNWSSAFMRVLVMVMNGTWSPDTLIQEGKATPFFLLHIYFPQIPCACFCKNGYN